MFKTKQKISFNNQRKSHENLPFLAHLWCSFILCFHLYFSQNPSLSPFLETFLTLQPFQHCDTSSCFMASACTLEGRIKNPTNYTVKLLSTKWNFFWYPRYLHVICMAMGKLKKHNQNSTRWHTCKLFSPVVIKNKYNLVVKLNLSK